MHLLQTTSRSVKLPVLPFEPLEPPNPIERLCFGQNFILVLHRRIFSLKKTRSPRDLEIRKSLHLAILAPSQARTRSEAPRDSRVRPAVRQCAEVRWPHTACQSFSSLGWNAEDFSL